MLAVLNAKVIVKPNRSLSDEGVFRLFVGLMVFPVVVALGFAMAGAWLVLPFVGLELLALLFGFMVVARHADDYEMITIGDDTVELEQCRLGEVVKHTFQRYWLRVKLCEVSHGRFALLLGSHGKEVEFGRTMMSNEQCVSLLQELKQKFNKN